MNNYEIYFILSPELSSEEVGNRINFVTELLSAEVGAENFETTQEGLQKLAYPIKKHRTGYYTLITFVAGQKSNNFSAVEKKLNVQDDLLRYLIVNQTEFLKQKSKEKLSSTEVRNHRELNKGNFDKKCIIRHIGYRAIDYRDVDFLNQFTSPYAKIFARAKTGVSSKYQRKVQQAVKRARHMALMPFTANYID